jgi:hypothetical protein
MTNAPAEFRTRLVDFDPLVNKYRIAIQIATLLQFSLQRLARNPLCAAWFAA